MKKNSEIANFYARANYSIEKKYSKFQKIGQNWVKSGFNAIKPFWPRLH